MGMSASQGRLLNITARLHEVEYKAQNIQAAKIALATEENGIYDTYCDAINKTKIQVAYLNDDGSTKFVDGCFDTICTFKNGRMRQYALQDAETGEIMVDLETKEALDSSQDANTFIELMTGYAPGDPEADETLLEQNYYQNLWDLVKLNGYQQMNPLYKSDEDGCNWFSNMVGAGLMLIKEFIPTGSKKGWADTSVSTSSNQNYLQETEDDKAVKKAEAEYEHALNLINRKDSEFDLELSKLEAEEKALTTEIDSISKVRDDNEERTFGIFG